MEVSESAFEFLLSEIIALPLKDDSDLDGHSSQAGQYSSSGTCTSVPSGFYIPNAGSGVYSMENSITQRLDAIGYDVGYRYVEKIVAGSKYLGSEPLDLVKFVCKEFWEAVFKKKIDKLQTNHRGVFVLSDYKFKWLERYAFDDIVSKEAAVRLLHFPCGILRGALSNLGLAANVTADFNSLPGCTFNIKVLPISVRRV